MSSLKDRADVHEKGMKSVFYKQILDLEPSLTEEQASIMALIWENMPPTVAQVKMEVFVRTVQSAQSLMPGGTIRSRQVLSTLAVLAVA